mmetsp:Transcript_1709/g.3299  ORF Transcript_1709/g.3299 Transcript_1709/m.3299 type:complete len:758 (-) Transcript_1709:292-2565(-)
MSSKRSQSAKDLNDHPHRAKLERKSRQRHLSMVDTRSTSPKSVIARSATAPLSDFKDDKPPLAKQEALRHLITNEPGFSVFNDKVKPKPTNTRLNSKSSTRSSGAAKGSYAPKIAQLEVSITRAKRDNPLLGANRILYESEENENKYLDGRSAFQQSFSSRSKVFHQSFSSAMSGLQISVSEIEHEAMDEGERRDEELIRHMSGVEHSGARDLHRDVMKIEDIGEGATGAVFLGMHAPSLKLVAVKEQSVIDESEEDRLMQELEATAENIVPITGDDRSSFLSKGKKKENCPYIVAFYGAWCNQAQRKVFMVMEYMDAGALDGVVKKGGIQSEIVLQRIAYCGLRALEHLHKSRTVHRDVKPANILINHRGLSKLSDLGVAKKSTAKEAKFKDQSGTVSFYSPERVENKEYGYPADIWGLGASILALAIGKNPFVGSKIFDIREQVLKHDVAKTLKDNESKGLKAVGLDGEAQKSFSGHFVGLLTSMMQQDPNKRGTATELLQHPFFLEMPNGIPDDTSAVTFSDPITGKSPGGESPFAKEWNRTIGKDAKDKRKLLEKIKKTVAMSNRFSRWFRTTVEKIKSRSSRDLLGDQRKPSVQFKRLSSLELQGKGIMVSAENKRTVYLPPQTSFIGAKRTMSSDDGGPRSEVRPESPPHIAPQLGKTRSKYRATASDLEVDTNRSKRRSDTVDSLGESEAVQTSLWEAFSNLAYAVGIPRAELMAQLKTVGSDDNIIERASSFDSQYPEIPEEERDSLAD